jgi:catechol 2,3-dioxygenase-like lactoylglutathione lyase family enzyme
MWGEPPIYIPESFCVEVRNFDAAQAWYREKIGFKISSTDTETDARNVVFQFSQEDQSLTLIEKERVPRQALSFDRSPAPLFYAKKLGKAHSWLQGRGIAVGPIETDSGGNSLFHFQDLDGNKLEVCQET